MSNLIVLDGGHRDLMIDIETLGDKPGAVIVQIAAAFFDPMTGEVGETFTRNVDIESSFKYGFEVTGGTLKFWLSELAKDVPAWVTDEGAHIVDVLNDLRSFIFMHHNLYVPEGVNKRIKVWANSPRFDCEILRSAYEKAGAKAPWEYFNEIDVRTLVDIGRRVFKIDPKGEIKNDSAHDALDDVLHQIKYVAVIMQAIQGERC